MNKTTRTRTSKVPNKPKTEVVQPEETKPLASNKYAPKQRVGTPQLRSPITVKSVGLGNLEVITANGYTDV